MTLALRQGGIYAPVITPFGKDGELDRAAFEHNVRAHMQHGLNGVVVTGSTGEAPLLDERERDSLIEWSRPLVTGDRLVIAGVGRSRPARRWRTRAGRRSEAPTPFSSWHRTISGQR
jgi:dihydrodipicolinate synthase/N-acetylneuraminate lyase